jgi:hypothetical protein
MPPAGMSPSLASSRVTSPPGSTPALTSPHCSNPAVSSPPMTSPPRTSPSMMRPPYGSPTTNSPPEEDPCSSVHMTSPPLARTTPGRNSMVTPDATGGVAGTSLFMADSPPLPFGHFQPLQQGGRTETPPPASPPLPPRANTPPDDNSLEALRKRMPGNDGATCRPQDASPPEIVDTCKQECKLMFCDTLLNKTRNALSMQAVEEILDSWANCKKVCWQQGLLHQVRPCMLEAQ